MDPCSVMVAPCMVAFTLITAGLLVIILEVGAEQGSVFLLFLHATAPSSKRDTISRDLFIFIILLTFYLSQTLHPTLLSWGNKLLAFFKDGKEVHRLSFCVKPLGISSST